ncbi:unnamed protein product [Caenorhabditis auriculariae]|uniref:SH2 domain-containing protein n=1 Tax=Caenorhabditis auriculariae TaxID=2777116 RepID=A0A8S1GLY9_9PELO|nr:unnamed protein product [Caenorhabditis auriculariae]
MACPTPYNSIYSTTKRVVCCKHGAKCKSFAKKAKEEIGNEKEKKVEQPTINEGDEQYVNLYAKKNQEELKKETEEKVPSGGESFSSAPDTSFVLLDGKKVEKRKKKKRSRNATFAKSATSTEKSEPAPVQPNDFYIGACTREDAERSTRSRGPLRIYHQIASSPVLENLQQEVSLYIVYRTKDTRFRHYPIRSQTIDSVEKFYVDCGETGAPMHSSLHKLVNFYKVAY